MAIEQVFALELVQRKNDQLFGVRQLVGPQPLCHLLYAGFAVAQLPDAGGRGIQRVDLVARPFVDAHLVLQRFGVHRSRSTGTHIEPRRLHQRFLQIVSTT
jgi:hypothetical protein